MLCFDQCSVGSAIVSPLLYSHTYILAFNLMP